MITRPAILSENMMTEPVRRLQAERIVIARYKAEARKIKAAKEKVISSCRLVEVQ